MAREMNPNPNSIHRLIHKIAMVRPVTAFFAVTLHRIDGAAMKISGGKFTVSQLAGWTIIQLTTIGAKTGKKRMIPLIAALDEDKIGLIASSFGRMHNPGWYYNLKANPECFVELKGKTGVYIARETDGAEYEKFWRIGTSVFAGYEKYKVRAAHRRIPVMVLEPKR
ncbi:MAG TPA: hypothetical protein DCX53_09030 [Anaerolineae bacterium]|nr:hypothetical protein [Anaerolineae bacterium]